MFYLSVKRKKKYSNVYKFLTLRDLRLKRNLSHEIWVLLLGDSC